MKRKRLMLKITSSCGRRWYKDLVGELVPLISDTGTEYRSREPEGFTNFVQYEHCEIVEV